MKLEVGSTVKIREWDDMAKEFTVSSWGSIDCNCSFTGEMGKYCGQEYTIKKITDSGNFYITDDEEWCFSEDMIEKENGIMKYTKDDVLENDCNTQTIQGNVGNVYLTVNKHGHAIAYTEKELDDNGYALKTETTKTDMSVSEIEKALGKAAGSLNVVAE